jgi:hypothetical protein
MTRKTEYRVSFYNWRDIVDNAVRPGAKRVSETFATRRGAEARAFTLAKAAEARIDKLEIEDVA